MARADTPPLTHTSPAHSEYALPLTPTPESPPPLHGGRRPSLWGHDSHGRVANGTGGGYMAVTSPKSSLMTMAMELDLGRGKLKEHGVSMHLSGPAASTAGKSKARAATRPLDEGVFGDDLEVDFTPARARKAYPLRGSKKSAPSFDHRSSICTTFYMPRLYYDDQYNDIHFGVQQYFVYYGYPLISMSYSTTERSSCVEITTPPSMMGVFEDTVMSICQQAVKNPALSIRIERE